MKTYSIFKNQDIQWLKAEHAPGNISLEDLEPN